MIPDWENFEGVQVIERLLGAAVEEGAVELHISSDGEGAAVFMVSPDSVEFYARLPAACRDRVLAYLRTLAGIDSWVRTPARGMAAFVRDGAECQLEIRLSRSERGEDAVVRIVR